MKPKSALIDFFFCILCFVFFELNVIYPSIGRIDWGIGLCLTIGVLAGRCVVRMSEET